MSIVETPKNDVSNIDRKVDNIKIRVQYVQYKIDLIVPETNVSR